MTRIGTGNPKLTPAQVQAIRADRRPTTKIAPDYGVTQQAVSKIKLCYTHKESGV